MWQDPNGLQELPIIVGLHNYKVNLVAMGTNSTKPGSYDLFDDIMSRSVHYNNIPLLGQNEISDKIIDEVKCVPSGEFLHVSLGGEYFELADALDTEPSIASKIKAYGLYTSNADETNKKLNAYNKVKNYLGSNLRTIDFYNATYNQWKDRTQYFSKTEVRQVFHVFYPRDNFTEDQLNNILFNRIYVKLDGITDHNNISITDTHGDYLQHVKNMNQDHKHVDASSDLYLRVADFLTVADVFMSIQDIYNTSKMHNLIEEATSKF